MVKPIPVNTPTPYNVNQLELFGICANPNFIDIYENIKTPSCLPIKSPNKIPSGTGKRSDENEIPSKKRQHSQMQIVALYQMQHMD